MPWWPKPFTLIVVPHDDSTSRPVTLNGLTVLISSLLLGLLAGTGIFFAFYGFTATHSVKNPQKLSKQLAKLRQQNRRYHKLSRSLSTLQEKLREADQLQRTILELNGFDEFDVSGQQLKAFLIDQNDNTATKYKKTRKILQRQIRVNKKLKTVKRLVENRNKVFKHTPVLWPVDGWLSSSYGVRHDPMGGKDRSFHEGVDLAAWYESPVRAPATGTVVFSGIKGGYGHMVRIRHEYGYTTVYAHLSKREVDEGEPVVKGEVIGRVGSTGHATGSHLHYEVRVNGKTVNPWPYLVQQYDTYESILDQEVM